MMMSRPPGGAPRCRWAAAAGILSLGVLTQPAGSRAAQPVTLDVAVATAKGARLAGLPRDAFSLFIDGAPTVLDAVDATPVPLSVVLVLDISPLYEAGTSFDDRDVWTALTKHVVGALRPTDRVRVGHTGAPPVFTPVLAGSAPQLTTAVKAMANLGRKAEDARNEGRRGSSAVWDAAGAAIRLLADEPGRRSVVLVTDGRVAANRLSAADVESRAAGTGVIVGSITGNKFVPNPPGFERLRSPNSRQRPTPLEGWSPMGDRQHWTLLERIATHSGGRVFFEDEWLDAPDAPIRDLREMYTLRFTSPHTDGKMHKVEVRVNRPGAVVRTRTGYLAPGAP